MITDTARFNKTIASFDAINAKDPNLVKVDGIERPKELVYAERMSDMLDRYAPEASEALKLAARAQHIERWVMPRNDFPMTKPGYIQWRTKLNIIGIFRK
jgi:DNA repair ATPase RecN